MNTTNDICDGCGGTSGLVAFLDNGTKVCAHCTSDAADAIGESTGKIEALEAERDDAKADAKTAEEDRDEAQEECKAAERRAADAETERGNQEALAGEYHAELEKLRAEVEALRAASFVAVGPVSTPSPVSVADAEGVVVMVERAWKLVREGRTFMANDIAELARLLSDAGACARRIVEAVRGPIAPVVEVPAPAKKPRARKAKAEVQP